MGKDVDILFWYFIGFITQDRVLACKCLGGNSFTEEDECS